MVRGGVGICGLPSEVRLRRRELLRLGAAAAVAGSAGVVIGSWGRPGSLGDGASATPTRASSLRLIGVGDAVMRFGSLGGPLAWDPAGRFVAVEQTAKDGTHSVSVYDLSNWSKRFELAGSRPSWSPDSVRLALIRPFPATSPPVGTSVVIASAASGTELETIAVPTASVGWSSNEPYGLVGDHVAPLRSPATAAVRCATGCDIGEWASGGDYVAVGDGSTPSQYQIASLRDSSVRTSLGVAESFIWASVPVLAWRGSDGVSIWSAREGTKRLPLTSEFRPATWSPDGTTLVCARIGTHWVQWSSIDNQVHDFEVPPQFGAALRTWWSPSGRFVATVPQSFGPAEAIIFAATVSN